jgi:hypothetical protein
MRFFFFFFFVRLNVTMKRYIPEIDHTMRVGVVRTSAQTSRYCILQGTDNPSRDAPVMLAAARSSVHGSGHVGIINYFCTMRVHSFAERMF